MPEILPDKEKDEDLKTPKKASMDAGKVSEVKPAASQKEGGVVKPAQTPSAESQVSQNEKGWQSSTASSGTGPVVTPADGSYDLGDIGGGSTVTAPPKASGNTSGRNKNRQQNPKNNAKFYLDPNTGGNISVADASNIPSVTGQPMPGPNGQNYTVSNDVFVGQSIHGNSTPLQMQTLDGNYDMRRMDKEVQDAATAPMKQAEADAEQLDKDVQQHQDELDQKDKAASLENAKTAMASDYKNRTEGSAYEHVEPQSTWGKENRARNAGAAANTAIGIVGAVGDAINRGLDVFDSVMRMTFQGGLHPGMIGHSIGMSLDAAGKVFDDAIGTAGSSMGIDINKLKMDPNAIGTFKGKQALQEEADIKNASLDAQKMAGQALAESIGWKGGEMRPEDMQGTLQNMNGEQLKTYGENLMAAMERPKDDGSPSDYTRIMSDFERWQMENPGVSSTKYPISAKDKAIIGAYQQMLIPYKQALRESDARYRDRAAGWRPYKQRAVELKRQVNEAKRQGRKDADAKLAEFNQIYYDATSGVERDVLDILGGPQGKYDIDEYGNIDQNSLYNARRMLEARGITSIKAKQASGQQLTPDEQKALNIWTFVNDTLEKDIAARQKAKDDARAKEIEEYKRTHSPLEVALWEAGVNMDDKGSYSDKVYGTTGQPKTPGLRRKVRRAAKSTMSRYSGANIDQLSPQQIQMYNSARNAIYTTKLQDRFDVFDSVLDSLEARSDFQTGEKIRDAREMLHEAHMKELAKHPSRDYTQASDQVENPQLFGTSEDEIEMDPEMKEIYELLDKEFNITFEAKKAAQEKRKAERQKKAKAKAKKKKTETKKSALYARVLQDPVAMNAFKKAGMSLQAYRAKYGAKERTPEEIEAAKAERAKVQMPDLGAELAQRKAAAEAKKLAQEEEKKEEIKPEPIKAAPLKRTRVPAKKGPTTKVAPTKNRMKALASDSTLREIASIKDPEQRRRAEAAKEFVDGIEAAAKDTKHRSTGSYTQDDLEFIKDAARRGMNALDKSGHQRLYGLYRNNPDLTKYFTAVQRLDRYTDAFHSDQTADPKERLEGEKFDPKRTKKLMALYYGDKADEYMGSKPHRDAAYLLNSVGVKSLDINDEASYDAAIKRLDSAIRYPHTSGTRDALMGVRNRLIMDFTKRKLDKIKGQDKRKKKLIDDLQRQMNAGEMVAPNGYRNIRMPEAQPAQSKKDKKQMEELNIKGSVVARQQNTANSTEAMEAMPEEETPAEQPVQPEPIQTVPAQENKVEDEVDKYEGAW